MFESLIPFLITYSIPTVHPYFNKAAPDLTQAIPHYNVFEKRVLWNWYSALKGFSIAAKLAKTETG
jgi:hypothetical protein